MADDNWGGLMGGVAGLAGGLMGLVGQGGQDDRQVRQQGKLNDLQVKSQKEMADYQMMMQKKMWDETNFEEQVKHMKKAGLSVGLMAGKGGAGGATVGGGTGQR